MKVITIGRSSDNNVIIDDLYFARNHFFNCCHLVRSEK